MKRLALVTGLLCAILAAGPAIAGAKVGDGASPAAGTEITADLDGVPIPTAWIPKLQCNDFDFPAIHCFTSSGELAASLDAELSTNAATGLDYVQIYENSNFGGASMIVSQDYSVLAFIGWNDRISSFKAKNSQTGTFYTDWFAGGTAYGFCCNQQVASLGGFNDTFSSVYNN